MRLKKTLKLAHEGKLYAPKSFKIASVYELRLVCNGCGAADAKFDFIPDTIYFTYIGYACHIHDWMYDEGETIEDKERADRIFLNNLYRIIKIENAWWKPTFLMRQRALKYYLAVKHFGGDAFWSGKQDLSKRLK